MLKKLPLLHSQLRLWYEYKLSPSSTAYNNQFIFKLTGKLDQEILKTALGVLTNRYEALRTYFVEDDSVPSQIILPNIETVLEFEDLSKLTKADRKSRLNDRLKQIALEIIDITQPPLFRYNLIKIGQKSYYISFTWHHIIIDGTSIKIFFEELSKVYHSLYNLKSINFSSIYYGISECVQHEKDAYKEDNLKLAIDYWEKRLQNANFNIDFGITNIKKEFPADVRINGNRRHYKLSEELSLKIIDLVNSTKTTLFIVLTAIFKTLIFRYTGVNDITIGYTINIRNSVSENILGFFVNNLPFHITIDKDDSFISLVTKISELRKADKTYQATPLQIIVDLIRRKKQISSLINVAINQITHLSFNLSLFDIISVPIPIKETQTKNDFTFLFDYQNVVSLELEYDTTQYPEWYIEQIFQSLICLLEDVVDNPYKKLSDLNVISTSQKKRFLSTISTKEKKYKNIINLFEEQARLNPFNTALIFGNVSLSYPELESRVLQLAVLIKNRIRSLDTERLFCGVFCDRSLEMVVSLLAIFKIGATFVPLDPTLPKDRLKFIIQNTGLKLIITSSNLQEQLFSISDGIQIILFEEVSLINLNRNKDFKINYKINDLAYLLYTSGSTGVPKGVMVEQDSLINHMIWMKNTFSLDRHDRVLQKTTFTFDASIWEFLLPLISGATLVLARPEGHRDVEYLAQCIMDYEITVIQFVPTFLELFLNFIKSTNIGDTLKNLRYIFSGGEALKTNVIKELHKLTNAKLINLYGPTETTIDATYFCFNPNSEYYDFIPIGKSIDNTICYVLDKNMHLCPKGVDGELYISGRCLARGYYNLIDAEKSSFLSNPFVSFTNKKKSWYQKVYKTGDKVRWINNDILEYRGRVDRQIKLNGFRIELEEIETILNSYPNVEQSVVLINTIFEDSKLIAYVKLHDKLNLNAYTDLKDYLISKLPYYMVPSQILAVSDISITTSGKIDRKKLETLIVKDDKVNLLNPRNHTEFELLVLWKEILNNPNIGINDNFFFVGGSSVSAIRLTANINSKFKTKMSMVDVLRNPTLENMAGIIYNKESKKKSEPSLIVFHKCTTNKELICIHPAGGTSFCYMQLANLLSKEYTVYGVQSIGVDNTMPLHTSIKEMAAYYIKLLQQTRNNNQSCNLLGWSFGGIVAYEMAQQMKRGGIPVNCLFLVDTLAPDASNLNTIYEVSRDEFEKKLIRFNGVFSGITSKQISRYHEIYNTNLLAFKNYKAERYDGKVILCKIRKDGLAKMRMEVHLWKNFVSNSLNVMSLDADHWSLMDLPYVQDIAKAIQQLTDYDKQQNNKMVSC